MNAFLQRIERKIPGTVVFQIQKVVCVVCIRCGNPKLIFVSGKGTNSKIKSSPMGKIASFLFFLYAVSADNCFVINYPDPGTFPFDLKSVIILVFLRKDFYRCQSD